MLCADLIELEWRDKKGSRRRTVANLEDISASGACLQVEFAIPLHTDVRLVLPQQSIKGSIRYCVHREIGYYLGIEFGVGERWSQRAFRPQHLFDPRRLTTAESIPEPPPARARSRAN
jgi:hypothetical protein